MAMKRVLREDYIKTRSVFNPAKYRKVCHAPTTVYNTLSLLSTNPSKVSCVYLVRTRMFDEQDDNRVFKYGYTNDLMRRITEHEKRYGTDITLQIHVPIPTWYLRDAENDLKTFFGKGMWTYSVPTYNELVKIDDLSLEVVTEFYKTIGEKYNKSYEVLVTENDLLHKILKIKI